MAHQISYYIFMVHYSTYHNHKEHIERVLIKFNLGDNLYYEKKRTKVVSDIEILDKIVYTAYESKGSLVKGAQVITEVLDGIHYIKTKRDKLKRDNLDELPEY